MVNMLYKPFNKTRDDFDSEREYNDYLEMVEDITFNLINNIDRPETESRITEYTNANSSQITSNASRAREATARQRAADLEAKRTRTLNVQRAREEEALGEAEREGLKARAWEEIAKGGTGEGAYARLKRLKAGSIPSVVPSKALPASTLSLGKENTSPLSPSYAGPYVPYPFSQPSDIQIPKSTELHDPPTFEGQRRAHGTDTGRVRAGGWVVEELWERDWQVAAESLWVL
ncbi:hypothetical protein QFC22_004702 [Naganishia vaughanmartiniae]|uniref:Uncharacterized protein n=1 Tax=Naganishia vaughanmartiniae TaxID=1424756 RepID=A0ACC2WZX1_9TREE|nr:hypothetical protein QFC22_004702 [Naganishia vaughanmartiniae]